MIKCPHCGGELNYEVTNQKVKCDYCKSEFIPSEFETKVKYAKERKNPNAAKGKNYTCSQCGATLMTFDDTAITFCSYCGSQAMLEDKTNEISPDYVIPFKKTKEECIEEYNKKIKSSFFVPDYLKDNVTIEKFRGIFMPYGIYKLSCKKNISNHGKKYNHRSGDYVYYDDYDIKSNMNVEYNGISYDLASNYYDKYSMAIPFNYKEKVDFKPSYLVGFYADATNVESELYDSDARKVVKNDSTKKLYNSSKEYRKYGCTSPTIPFDVEERKMALFPVYFLSIRNEKNDSIYYAVVNGQTGKIVMDLPVSFKKYVIFSLIISVIVFLFINFLLAPVFKPSTISVISIIFAVISIIISLKQASQINSSRYHLDDKGYSVINRKEYEKVNKFKYIVKDIIAIIIPVLAFVINNHDEDMIFYGSSLISLILVLLSFKDLVNEHNLLASNKIPQLEKRGGDK